MDIIPAGLHSSFSYLKRIETLWGPLKSMTSSGTVPKVPNKDMGSGNNTLKC